MEVGKPGPGQARVKHTAIGLNMIDTYFRRGLYKTDLPFIPGIILLADFRLSNEIMFHREPCPIHREVKPYCQAAVYSKFCQWLINFVNDYSEVTIILVPITAW